MDLTTFSSKAEAFRVLGVMISRPGRETVSRFWDDACRRNIYSASKTYTALAVGIAIREGLLSLDEKLTDAFPKEIPVNPCENLRRATVRDLLTMCLGQAKPFLMGADRCVMEEEDWVRASLAQPFEYEPGTRFVYNNVGPYLAGILVQRRAGCDLVSYLPPRLFEPMGIRRPTWETDPQGNTFGAGGLMLTLPEMHKLGLLFHQKGEWNGRQLISPLWLEECSRKQVENGRQGYGYLMWRGEHDSYRADGKYGQLSIVFPDRDAVVSLQCECRDTAALFRAIYDDIYPQL